MNVKGIGEKSFLKLKPMVTVSADKAEKAGDRPVRRAAPGAIVRRRAGIPPCERTPFNDPPPPPVLR